MQIKPVGWFEIYVQDMKRAKAFYKAVFSMQLEKLDGPDSSVEMWSFPGPMDDSNGASGALVKMNGSPAGGNGVIVYFTCKDCATPASRVSSSGGKVTKEKFPLGKFGFAALITDTEGNVIGLHSMH
jgi:predicted enzyme related to lactoylglutathione lyase